MGSALNVIQHNMMSMFTDRQLGITTNSKAKSIEKLSSGYKINRAADDAAGLAISEKMRKLIRGLDQGSDNIQDGISMVQTADGALEEVTNILQRMNELSIKAYNGTNSQSDRQNIQEEIDQLKKEIDRTSETAKFNELYLLKGNPVRGFVEDVTIPAHTEKVDRTKKIDKKAPDWFVVDTKLQTPHSYNDKIQSTTQDELLFTYDITQTQQNGKTVETYHYKYYGPSGMGDIEFGGNIYKYEGSLSPELSDNASAKLSFQAIADATSIDDLYEKTFDLLGTCVGAPCNTCKHKDKFFGIGYEGKVGDYSAQITSFSNYNYVSGAYLPDVSIDLPSVKVEWGEGGQKVGIFDAIEGLLKEKEESGMVDSSKVSNLAKKIASALRDESVYAMSKSALNNSPLQNGHFDRVMASGSYDMLIYDFRDTGKLTREVKDDEGHLISVEDSKIADSYLLTWSCVNLKYKEDVEIPEETRKIYGEYEEAIKIQCSDQLRDYIPIQLPKISLETLDLTDYQVTEYTTEFLGYDDDYEKRHREWENDYTDDVTEKTVQEEVPILGYRFKNGELENYVKGYDTITKTMFEHNITYHSEEPQPDLSKAKYKTYYNPSDVQKIIDALKIVTDQRAYLGAIQNRLEHAYANNQNKLENTTASESRIRDTDMATEMVRFSNKSILEQAGQSMLTQANQSRNYILSLLQG